MQLYEFKETLIGQEPPKNVSLYLQALWFDAKKDWDKAHEIVQEIPDKKASWIHAYLHRKEGDVFNSEYWYTRAARKRPDIPLDKEWDQIAEAFLQV